MERMLSRDAIVVGPAARSLAQEILHPRPLVLKMAGPLFALITAGLLPERLREGYGLNWDARKEQRVRRRVKTIRISLQFLPRPGRSGPNARIPQQSLDV